jgi:hypothetical protein
MPKVYLKCIRVGGKGWESNKDGDSVSASLSGDSLIEIAVGDVLVFENPELATLFGSLTPEQQEAALEYDGPEEHGDPEWRNKR